MTTYWQGNKVEALRFAINELKSIRQRITAPIGLLIYNSTITELEELLKELEINA